MLAVVQTRHQLAPTPHPFRTTTPIPPADTDSASSARIPRTNPRTTWHMIWGTFGGPSGVAAAEDHLHSVGPQGVVHGHGMGRRWPQYGVSFPGVGSAWLKMQPFRRPNTEDVQDEPPTGGVRSESDTAVVGVACVLWFGWSPNCCLPGQLVDPSRP